jgi:predicted nucleic acid-binding protein
LIVVADTGAIVALVDASDRHHEALRRLFADDPEAWVLPWAVLPEVDYLLARHVGPRAQQLFMSDLASGAYRVAWGEGKDLRRAREIDTRYKSLRLGLVDGVVIAVAERLAADAIATLDLRHFGAVSIKGQPKLLPRDL